MGGSGSWCARFEVLSMVTVNIIVLCDVTPCSLVDVCTCFIHLADYTASHPRRQLSSVCSTWPDGRCFFTSRDSVNSERINGSFVEVTELSLETSSSFTTTIPNYEHLLVHWRHAPGHSNVHLHMDLTDSKVASI
jgi:hypothetical protein